MYIYGELKKADLENLSSDPSSGVIGRIYWNTTTLKAMIDDGTHIYSLLRNDANLVIGNNGTAANNVRLNRGANALLQLVIGSDVTAEGTLSTTLAQLSAKIENYTNSGLPASGNAGRLAWVTDKTALKVDTGSLWAVVGSSGAAGVLHWVEDVDSPTPIIDNAVRVYNFGAGLSQFLYTTVRVPNSYIAGSQINMRALAYSSDTTNNLLFQTISTLIRSGTDVVSSTTNQRTSSNSAISLSGSTASKPQAVVCDLTDSSGQVNGVAVSPGDLLIVQFKRGSDTSTVDANALMYGFEVTFG